MEGSSKRMAYQHTGKGDPRRSMRLNVVLEQIRKNLEDTSESQSRLATARQQLLIKRERVRTSSRKVQRKRVDAGDAEATFMSRLRESVNHHREELPSSLLDAYDEVERTRNNLGEIEEDYLQAERELTGAEWTFMDQENAFYQFDLHNILPGEVSEEFVPSPDRLPTLYPYPPPPPPPPFFLPLSNDGPIGSSIRPPPPLSPQPFSIPFPGTLTPTTLSIQQYHTVVAEVEGLRKDFEHLRHKKAQYIDWGDDSDIQSADGEDTSNLDLTASTMEYFDILHKLSDREARAQQLKIEEMSQHLPASTLERRYSEPTPFLTHASASSTAMRRAQTESAASMLYNDQTAKDKIREWSLTYLKDNAVQKHLYINTLEHHGVFDLEGCDWRYRAEQYWSQDSWSGSRDGSEYHGASTKDTTHEADSYTGGCATRRPSPSSSLQNLLEWEDYNPNYDHAIVTAFGFDPVHLDAYVDIPLPPSPSLLPETSDRSNTALPSVLGTSHSPNRLEEKSIVAEPMNPRRYIEQREVSGLGQGSDSSLRKDSCHSMDDDHDKKPNHIDNQLATEPPQRDERITETIFDSERHEDIQQTTPTQLEYTETFTPQHAALIEEPTKATLRPSLNISGVQSSSALPIPLSPSAYTRSCEITPLSRPTSERSELSKSFSRRIRDMLSRSGHQRSKSTSFFLGHTSVDETSTLRSNENGQSLSS
jgi:hypothetical protein